MVKKISIRELFLLVLVVALFLGWLATGPAYRELQQLRTETGYIRQDSNKVIYVRQRGGTGLESPHWRFKVLVPEGANYKFEWNYSLGAEKPLSAPRSFVKCADSRQVDLTAFVHFYPDNKDTVYKEGVYLDCVGHGGPAIDMVLSRETVDKFVLFNRAVNFSNSFSPTYDYKSGLHEFPVGETITLLRLEGEHPETEADYWIELNLSPMTEAEINWEQRLPGNFKPGSMMGSAFMDEFSDAED